MKKISLALVSICLSTAALAETGKVTIYNTSQDGYMTVNYKICHGYQDCSSTKTIDIDSSKWGKHYATIDIPVSQNTDILVIEKAVEKEIVEGIRTNKTIAKTLSESGVCDAVGGSLGQPSFSEGLELNDMHGSPNVVCKRVYTVK